MPEFDQLFANLDTGRRVKRAARYSGRAADKLIWGVRPRRGHFEAAFKRLQGRPDIWRGPGLPTAADGVGRTLQVLRAMAAQPRAWWARFDIRDATGMPYNSVKAIIRLLERRGLVERRAVVEYAQGSETEDRVTAAARPSGHVVRRNCARVRFRATVSGRWLIALCE